MKWHYEVCLWEAIRSWWDYEGRAPMMRFVSSQKEKEARVLPLCHMNTQWEGSCLKARSGSSADTRSVSTLILDVPDSRTVRNKCSSFKSPVYGVFVAANPNQLHIEQKNHPTEPCPNFWPQKLETIIKWSLCSRHWHMRHFVTQLPLMKSLPWDSLHTWARLSWSHTSVWVSFCSHSFLPSLCSQVRPLAHLMPSWCLLLKWQTDNLMLPHPTNKKTEAQKAVTHPRSHSQWVMEQDSNQDPSVSKVHVLSKHFSWEKPNGGITHYRSAFKISS